MLRVCGTLVIASLLALLGCTEGQSAQPRTASPESASATSNPAETAPDLGPEAMPVTLPDGKSRSVAQQLQDASRATQITQALVRERNLRIFDFDVQVVDTVALLQGDVNTKTQYDQAARIARTIRDVRAVQNALTVGGQPVEALGASGEGEAEAAYHTVDRGETLWDIAAEYSATVSRLRELNSGVSSSGLQPGQRLRVR